jgi:hypothetical protein
VTEQDPRLPDTEGGSDAPTRQNEAQLEKLREILFSRYRQQIAELEAEVDELERRVSDEDALIGMIAPVLGDAIRRKIRDAREEMIEALYPIIGRLVVRAVSEAISDLTRTIDARVRTSFSPRVMWWRLRARIGGASEAEMMLREAMPFQVEEIFLIHRETGLLLRHVSHDGAAPSDSDLISSMLTAIRDFSQDAFGRGEEGELEEIEYGERRILIEAAQYAYLAVVVEGIEPPGFRAEMRERVIEVNHAHEEQLRRYDGDPTPLATTEGTLRELMRAAQPRELSGTQKRLLAGVAGLMLLCLVGACLAGRWAWQALRVTPTPISVVVAPTATATPTPTATATPSSTPTTTATPSPTATSTAMPSPTPTATATATPLPTATPTPSATPTHAPVMGLMTGNVWVRQGPAEDAPRLGVILERGQTIEITAAFDDWCRVRWVPEAQAEITGWVPGEWVGTLSPIPAEIITPTVVP